MGEEVAVEEVVKTLDLYVRKNRILFINQSNAKRKFLELSLEMLS